MPTSTYVHIPEVIRIMTIIKPNSVLDVGLGNGKMGFLARDLLDVMLGQSYLKKDWKILIDGIEVFPAYIQEHQRFIYDHIFIGDAFEIIETTGKYDLIILGDVLEHFPKEKAWGFLNKCYHHCNNYLLINLPIGEGWTQKDIYGNEHEQHLSFWELNEFENFFPRIKTFELKGFGLYAVILISVANYFSTVAVEAAEKLTESDKKEILLKKSLELNPQNINAYIILTDILLKNKKYDNAIALLEELTKKIPSYAEGHSYLEQVKLLRDKLTDHEKK